MKLNFLLFSLALSQQVGGVDAFQSPLGVSLSSSTSLHAKSRKAKRQQNVEKQARGRSKQFYEAIEDAKGNPVKKEKPKNGSGKSPPQSEEEARRAAMAMEAQERMEARPDVSTMIVDEETGIEVIAQGQSVLDVVTRKAVKLSDMGPQYRLAQMFPGVPEDIREKYRFDWNTVEVPEMVEKLREACSVKLEDGSTGIPPHPSVANSGVDFVLANRDYLGYNMKSTLGRLTLKAASEERDDEAKEYQKLWKNFLTLENHISAPFRQIIQDAEGRVGPNFGNLELRKFCSGDLYERVGNYIVLKGMVAHWEKKVVDADYVEKTPQTRENFVSVLARGDPKRYLPDPPILFSLKECTQVCAMAQKMCQQFTEDEELFGDFPPEIVFLEEALKVKGGTALRKFMIDEFCPAQGITPEGLREGMRRFYQQLENMQIDPYGDLTNKLEDLYRAMAIGTDDERDPYAVYTASVTPGSPGFFQTYTFNHSKNSIVSFLDNQYPSAANSVDLFTGAEEGAEEEGGSGVSIQFLDPSKRHESPFSHNFSNSSIWVNYSASAGEKRVAESSSYEASQNPRSSKPIRCPKKEVLGGRMKWDGLTNLPPQKKNESDLGKFLQVVSFPIAKSNECDYDCRKAKAQKRALLFPSSSPRGEVTCRMLSEHFFSCS